MWVLIALAGLGSMAVLATGATLGAGRRYDGRHVLPDPQEEWNAWMAENERGSMILAEEHPLEPLPAPVVDAEPWRRQITEELSPEALRWSGGGHPVHLTPEQAGRYVGQVVEIGPDDEPDEIVLPAYGGWISGPCLDPGPGDAAVDPPASPGPAECSPWLAEQLDVLRAWVERHQQYAEILT